MSQKYKQELSDEINAKYSEGTDKNRGVDGTEGGGVMKVEEGVCSLMINDLTVT